MNSIDYFQFAAEAARKQYSRFLSRSCQTQKFNLCSPFFNDTFCTQYNIFQLKIHRSIKPLLCSVKIRVKAFIHCYCKVSTRISQYCHQVFMMSKNFSIFANNRKNVKKSGKPQRNQNNKSNHTKFLQKSSHSSQN